MSSDVSCGVYEFTAENCCFSLIWKIDLNNGGQTHSYYVDSISEGDIVTIVRIVEEQSLFLVIANGHIGYVTCTSLRGSIRHVV